MGIGKPFKHANTKLPPHKCIKVDNCIPHRVHSKREIAIILQMTLLVLDNDLCKNLLSLKLCILHIWQEKNGKFAVLSALWQVKQLKYCKWHLFFANDLLCEERLAEFKRLMFTWQVWQGQVLLKVCDHKSCKFFGDYGTEQA